MTTDSDHDRLLADLRILDIGHVLAGPFVGSLLADFGAEVIKVELPDLARPGGSSGRRRCRRSTLACRTHPGVCTNRHPCQDNTTATSTRTCSA